MRGFGEIAERLRRSTVHVFNGSTRSQGSGIVWSPSGLILTNAHVALYASQVQVQANQSGDKLSATVEFIAPGIDLAVRVYRSVGFVDGETQLQALRPPVGEGGGH